MNSTNHSYNPFAAAAPTAATNLKIDCGLFYIPKQNPVRPRGEDAHFICPSENVFGVADGVGAWAEDGVDAGEYARTLMANCAAAAEASSRSESAADPKKILTEGYVKTKNIIGSSTACVVALRKDVVQAANVGDSGFMIFREKKLVYVSETQQHRFNCPFQLMTGFALGLPVKPWECRIKVFAGDIIVAGTDGLLDNVFGSEIEKVLAEEKTERVDPAKLARRLAELALGNSFNMCRTTPFSTAATKAGILLQGGKIDDITVIVAHVEEANPRCSSSQYRW